MDVKGASAKDAGKQQSATLEQCRVRRQNGFRVFRSTYGLNRAADLGRAILSSLHLGMAQKPLFKSGRGKPSKIPAANKHGKVQKVQKGTIRLRFFRLLIHCLCFWEEIMCQKDSSDTRFPRPTFRAYSQGSSREQQRQQQHRRNIQRSRSADYSPAYQYSVLYWLE